MPFKKEYDDKLAAIREIGLAVSEFVEIATYTELKITNKNGVYQARIGFVPVTESERDAVAEKITGFMERNGWSKE